jgi:hypothetical protein
MALVIGRVCFDVGIEAIADIDQNGREQLVARSLSEIDFRFRGEGYASFL